MRRNVDGIDEDYSMQKVKSSLDLRSAFVNFKMKKEDGGDKRVRFNLQQRPQE